MDLKKTGINTRNRVDLAHDRDYWRSLVNAALNLQVSYAMELVNYVYIHILYKSLMLLKYSLYFVDEKYKKEMSKTEAVTSMQIYY